VAFRGLVTTVLLSLACATAGPALAQSGPADPFELDGAWMPTGGGPTFFGGIGFHEDTEERQDGPSLVDYAGIPLSAAGLARALSYDSSLLSVPEHQCMPHPAMYSFWGPPSSPAGGPRISKITGPGGAVIALQVAGMFGNADRTIWMDGRPHPSDRDKHTWAGFTTGRWDRGVLETRTTHMKWGWIKRNGVYVSDRATVVTRYARHGDILTVTFIVDDPVYLTEPFIRTADFVPWSRPQMPRGAAAIPSDSFKQCYPTEETAGDRHHVPNYMPWANPFLTEEEMRYKLPAGAVMGGAVTALPDFIEPVSRRSGARTSARAAARRPAAVSAAPAASAPFEVLPVQGKVWMIAAQGKNVAVQIGDEGVVLVNTGVTGSADAILAAIRTLTDKPIRYVINTSAAPEAIGNNEVFATLAGGNTSRSGQGPTPAVVAHEKVLTRMTASGNVASSGWPTDAFLFDKRSFFFNGEAIDIMHQPSGNSDGDSIVHFRGSDVLVAGSLLSTTHYPRFNPAQGGSLKGLIDSMNAMLDITVPKVMQEGGTYVIPGEGRICDEADLAELRDQSQMIWDRFVNLAVTNKLGLAEAMAKNPLVDFDGYYNRPDWTTAQFAQAVYAEVTAKGGAARAE
jgi:cyclase